MIWINFRILAIDHRELNLYQFGSHPRLFYFTTLRIFIISVLELSILILEYIFRCPVKKDSN